MPDNGQVERMNRTLKDATVRRYYYDTHDQLRGHLGDFLAGYNFARRLKTLRGLTPLRVHLQDLDKRASTLQARPAPPNPGTKQVCPRGEFRVTPQGQRSGSPSRLTHLAMSGLVCSGPAPKR
jgi:hypothetical protein